MCVKTAGTSVTVSEKRSAHSGDAHKGLLSARHGQRGLGASHGGSLVGGAIDGAALIARLLERIFFTIH